MFSDCSSLQQLDLTNFNTGNVKDMSSMFWGCKALTEIDLSKFNTKNVTDMSCIFSGCTSLTKLNLSKFNTKNVTDMDNMFSNCNSLRTITSPNKNLNKKIIEQLKKLGFKGEPQQNEDNKFVWEKQPN